MRKYGHHGKVYLRSLMDTHILSPLNMDEQFLESSFYVCAPQQHLKSWMNAIHVPLMRVYSSWVISQKLL
jgi:hypothetical protein